MPALAWFRRDLRLADNPALGAAASVDGTVVPLFVVDPAVWEPSSDVRRAYLVDSLRSLDESLDGNLLLQRGDPAQRVLEVAKAAGARQVHVAADFGPYGVRRDAAVREALAAHGIDLVETGSPYAVAPGRVTKDDGTSYRVYTPFYRAWMRHGWRAPAADVKAEWLMPVDCHGYPERPELPFALPPAGEAAALERWDAFRSARLAAYDDTRNLPALDGTSTMGHHLKWGEIHPRTILAELGDSPGEETFRKEIAWREFYADVLAQRPDSAQRSMDVRFDDDFAWDSGPEADARFEAWAAGRTGYPFLDAGMRQLLAEGWMHNRVRMVVASFLVKDLHLPWQRGAAHFMRWLRDGDLASNAHGWQWTAGCGTDASPYHRVFNPVGQGEKFDPSGDYVRRYVPELAHLPGKTAHTPWDTLGGYDQGYPERIVDHAAERIDALERLAAMKAAAP
ncbi:MAG: cryptochrome/photolyase family protein [bacterium]